MKHDKVVLLAGTYNIGASIEMPANATILGLPVAKSTIFRRVLRWVQGIWRKPPVFWLQMYKQRGTGEEVWLVTVAAINSSDEDKALADYRCDGIKDEIEIQAAIETAQSRQE